MFDEVRKLSQEFIRIKFERYQRYFIQETPLKHRFVFILGERGIGKTTTLVQFLLKKVNGDMFSDKILYVQCDHFVMQTTSLYEIAAEFYRLGGEYLAFDEIHKYPQWSMELKSIYDTFPSLTILASGSSALEIQKGTHDLSRRAVIYRMYGLSFREFLELKYNFEFFSVKLEDLLKNHMYLARDINNQMHANSLKILKLFKEYLEFGYYPYFKEFASIAEYKMTVEQNIHTTIEGDLAAIYPHLTGNSIKKIKQLITYSVQSVPFTPNWQSIKNITDIADDRTIKTYFKYLEDAGIIRALSLSTNKLRKIEAPEKIYLANTNQLYAFNFIYPNKGNVRETFFVSSLRPYYHVTTAKEVDFVVNEKFNFEVGGKNKDNKQLKNLSDSYTVLDDIEEGIDKRIPLWLFGFLY